MSALAAFSDVHQALWQRLCAHRFEAPEQGIDLLRRLAREQAWTMDEARAAVDEYRRFCFLSCVEGTALTPSDSVDQVWHLHLLHSRDYWEVFCPEVLQQSLHHGPTRGGRDEDARYREQYACTLAAYQRWFGAPPERHWPGHAQRFVDARRFRRVDTERYWLLPRPQWRLSWRKSALLCLMLALPGSAMALPLNPMNWTAGPFLTLYIALMVAAVIAALVWRRQLKNTGPASDSGLDLWQTAYLAGGSERCVDAAMVELMNREAIVVDAQGAVSLQVEPASLPAPLDAVARQVQSRQRVDKVITAAQPWMQARRAQLRQWGLLLSDSQARKAALFPALPLLVLLLFGVSKVLVGWSRGKPIGFLIVLCIVTGFIALVFGRSAPQRSRAGDLRLRELLESHAYLKRAPRQQDLPLAVALTGTAVLSGSAFAAYHSVRHPGSSDSGGDSSSDGGGSGGGGCGGCGGD